MATTDREANRLYQQRWRNKHKAEVERLRKENEELRKNRGIPVTALPKDDEDDEDRVAAATAWFEAASEDDQRELVEAVGLENLFLAASSDAGEDLIAWMVMNEIIEEEGAYLICEGIDDSTLRADSGKFDA